MKRMIVFVIVLLLVFLELCFAGERSEDIFKGFTFSGQITSMYQTSDLSLSVGDLKDSGGNDLSGDDLENYGHKSGTAFFFADFVLEKEIGENGYFKLELQLLNGSGTDAPLQGGAMINNMVNNGVMEDEVFVAEAFYEHTFSISDDYKFVIDVGKYGVTDFFDIGEEASTFLNYAICNNGAFDYVQDLTGYGYTYGTRVAAINPWITLDGALFSANSRLDDIRDKYSVLGGITFTPEFTEEIRGAYQIYFFKNFGEYGRFDSGGNFITKDPEAIGTADDIDNLNKKGFGISLNQSIPLNINLFAKYGRQDDDRDVRHNEDMDESYMFGFTVSGTHWFRENDVFGAAYEIGRLTKNHRKAQERGYVGSFDRGGGVGTGNYADERLLEVYYKFVINDNLDFTIDYQRIENFYYSRQIGNVDFWAVIFNLSF